MISRWQKTITVGIRVDAIKRREDVETAVDEALTTHSLWLMTSVNPASTILAKRHPEYAGMLQRFDVVTPDGGGMAAAAHLVHGCEAMRVSFDSTSLSPGVFGLAIKHKASVVLCGGKPGVAENARRQLVAAFPGLSIIAAFDGYADHVEEVKKLNPAIVVCGMGGLYQERFLLHLADAGWRGVGFSCGGYLDQLSGGLQYYPAWIDRTNLRFAYRLAREPRRLWRRYLLDYPQFCGLFAREWLMSRLAKRGHA